MKKLVELKERLVAIGEFANEAVALIDSMGDVAPAEKAPAKADKKAPVEKEVAVDSLAEVIADYDLESKSIAELKELLADTDIPYNKKGKKASEFVSLVAQGILDGKIGSDEEEESEDEESEDGEFEISEEDIQAMKLPELIEFAKENGIEIPKASAKSVAKVRELVLDWLVENSVEVDEDGEEELDEPAMSEEEVTALTEELMEKDLSELKEILELADIDIPAKAKKPALITLIIAGIIDGSIIIAEDEESEEEGYTEEDINALNLKELIALAKEAELEYTAKDAKSADKMKELLISALCNDSGDDEDASEEEEDDEELTQEDVEAMNLKELTALALDNDVDIPKAIAKKADKIKELLIETFFADDGEEEEDAVEEASEAVLQAEEKVRKDVASQIKSKKLTAKKIKEFLKQYYEGDPDCSSCARCSEEDIIDCYVNIQVNMVDDEGVVNVAGEPYVRKGENYCCGVTLKALDNGSDICEICGTEYE